MPDNALERLYAEMNKTQQEETEYSIDELMNENVSQSIFDVMGEEAKNNIMSKIEKVELEEPTIQSQKLESEIIFNNKEELQQEETEEPVVEVKRGRGRPRKEENIQVDEDDEEKKTPEKINSLNSFMDSLARDLIQELRDKKYETRNFNREQMLVILDYLEKKI